MPHNTRWRSCLKGHKSFPLLDHTHCELLNDTGGVGLRECFPYIFTVFGGGGVPVIAFSLHFTDNVFYALVTVEEL